MPSSESIECEWSYSKSALFANCHRAFYYKYNPGDSSTNTPLDGSHGWDDDDDQSPFYRFGSLIGQAIHEAIATEIDKWRTGANPRRQRAKTTAEHFLETHFNSVATRIQDAPTNSDQGTSLSSLTSTANQHIDTFIDSLWPNFRSHDYIDHESLHSLDIDQYRVILKPDLLTRSPDGEFVVTDWKTRTAPILSPSSPQLHVYALWARETFEPNPSRLRAQTAHTSDGIIKPVATREEHLSDIKARITAECDRWANRTTKEDYPPLPEQEKCAQCTFLSKCPEGRVEVSSDSTDST